MIAQQVARRRGRAAADDDPRHRRRHRGDAGRRDRRRPALPDRRAISSAISGCTRRSASRATARRVTAACPRRARPPPATCSSRRPGRRPRAPGRCARSRSAPPRGAAGTSRPSPSRASSPCWPGTCSPAARTTPSSAPASCAASCARSSCRPARRAPSPARTPDPVWNTTDRRRREAPRAAGRGRLPTPGRRLAGQRPEGGCGRDTGARISKALEGQGRAAGHKLLTPALRHVSHPHPTRSLPQGARTRQPV